MISAPAPGTRPSNHAAVTSARNPIRPPADVRPMPPVRRIGAGYLTRCHAHALISASARGSAPYANRTRGDLRGRAVLQQAPDRRRTVVLDEHARPRPVRALSGRPAEEDSR